MRSRALATIAFPVVILGSFGLVSVLTTLGLSLTRSWGLTAVGVVVVLAVVEWRAPRDEGQRIGADSQAPRDIAHTLLVSRLGGPFGAFLLPVAIATMVSVRDDHVWSWWPPGWPLPLQIAACWLAFGFLDYWIHRSYHSIDVLWPVHALHHDTDGLNVLKAGRVHLIEGIVTGAAAASLVVIGFPKGPVAVALALNAILSSLAHANLEQRLWGPLHWLVPTVHLHRIHHARARELHDTNLGIPLFDWLFGTYTPPASCPDPELGRTNPAAPTTLVSQLLHPLRQWSAHGRRHSDA